MEAAEPPEILPFSLSGMGYSGKRDIEKILPVIGFYVTPTPN